MFLLKKIISQFFMPLPVATGLLIIGLLLLRFARSRRAAGVVLTAATFMILIIGYGFFCDSALAGLERRYPPLDVQTARNAGVQWVVVLAGGHVSNEDLPVTSQLLHETQVRLIEGIRIHRCLPGSKLLVSGGSFLDPLASAPLMAELAGELGVDPEDIVVEDASQDTYEEAVLVRPIVGRRRFILVTSAYHIPRSMALFKAQGMQPIAAPVGHLMLEQDYITPRSFFPSSDKIRNCEIVFHEALGIVYAYLTGKLRPKEPEKRGEFSACSLELTGRYGRLTGLVVHEKWKGRGIGKVLTAKIEERLGEQGAAPAVLSPARCIVPRPAGFTGGSAARKRPCSS